MDSKYTVFKTDVLLEKRGYSERHQNFSTTVHEQISRLQTEIFHHILEFTNQTIKCRLIDLLVLVS